jgi:hypothetical protein
MLFLLPFRVITSAKRTIDFPEKASYTTIMSRVFVTAAIVLLVGALLLIGYDILSFRLGLPSVITPLLSLLPDVASGFGSAMSNYKGWMIGIISGLVVVLLLIRFPKFGRF